jgi:hypothetical protein
MTCSRFVSALAVVALATCAAPQGAEAAQARRSSRVVVRTAVPRVVARPVFSGRRVVAPFPFRSRVSIGVFAGYPYFYPYAYPYGYSAYGYGPYRYAPYGYVPYGYGYPSAYAAAYGGVRIQGAPRNAQVFADGYYAGVVDNFDGVFQRLDLTSGAHRIEIRASGLPTVSFDVRVVPGQTITYRADGRR